MDILLLHQLRILLSYLEVLLEDGVVVELFKAENILLKSAYVLLFLFYFVFFLL